MKVVFGNFLIPICYLCLLRLWRPGRLMFVKVRGRLPEAKAMATDLMAEYAELDGDLHVQVEVGAG